MGKYEVLGVLTVLRSSGDDGYYRYAEIHHLLGVHGLDCSYTAVWRSVNGLYCDGLLDVLKEGDILHRSLRFRARILTSKHSTYVHSVYNKYRKIDQSRAARIPEADRQSPGATRKAKPRGF